MRRTGFEDQRAYVFGGSTGIGLEIARQLAAAGAHVIIFARTRPTLEQALESVRSCKANDSQRFDCMVVDVADRAAIGEVCARAVAGFGPPAMLINCAGRALPRRFEQVTAEQLHETMAINLYGSWYTIAALLPTMRAQGHGHIVNTSSIAGFIGVFGFTDYAASKFALLGFSEALRGELKPEGIKVSVLCPPDTETPGLQSEGDGKPAETQAISANARLLQPEAVAAATLRGMRRNAPVIIPGFDGKLTWLAKRWAPGLVERVMDRTIRKVQRRREADQ